MSAVAIEQLAAILGSEESLYRELLTRYTNNFARATMQRWWELGDFFWAEFARGW